MQYGRIVRFDPARGFGFIRPDMAEVDVFLHVTGLVRNTDVGRLLPGARVSFEVTDNGRGPKAAEVKLVPEENAPPAPDGEAYFPPGLTKDAFAAAWQEAAEAAWEKLIERAKANGWL